MLPTIKYKLPGLGDKWLVECKVLDYYNNRYLIEYYDEAAEDWITVMTTDKNLVFPKFSELIF